MLSTGVLILISTTICLYIGTEDSIRVRYPRNIYVEIKNAGEEVPGKVKSMVGAALQEHGLEQKDEQSYYRDFYLVKQDGNRFLAVSEADYDSVSTKEYAGIECVTLEDYNRLTGKDETLEADEVLVYVEEGELEEGELSFGETVFRVKETLEELPISGRRAGICYQYVLPDPSGKRDFGGNRGGSE